MVIGIIVFAGHRYLLAQNSTRSIPVVNDQWKRAIAGYLHDLIRNVQRLLPKEFIYLGGISAPAFACGVLQSMVAKFKKIVSTFCLISGREIVFAFLTHKGL